MSIEIGLILMCAIISFGSMALVGFALWIRGHDENADRPPIGHESMIKQSVALGMWQDFTQGFIKGAKETPRGFFAPAVAIWRLLLDTTESLVKPK